MAARIGNWEYYSGSADPFSQALNIPVGTEAITVLTGLYDTGAPAFNTQTVGGGVLATVFRVTTDAAEQVGGYGRVNPSTGSQTLQLDHAGAIDEGMHVWVAYWEDVDTAGTPWDSLGVASNGANNATVVTPNTVSAGVGDIAIGIGCVFGTDGVTLNDEVSDATPFNSNDSAIGQIAGAGANVSFTVTSGDFPAVGGMVIRNAVGGGATIYTRRPLDSPIFTSRVIQ